MPTTISGTTGASLIQNNTVTTEKIVNGAITNDDISPTAAIAGTKISPNFVIGDGVAYMIKSSVTTNAPHLYLQNDTGATPNTFGPGLILQNGVTGRFPYIITQSQSTDSAFNIQRATTPFTRFFTIDQLGNVGINTFPNQNWSNSAAKLHVKAESGFAFAGLFEGSGFQYTPIITLKPIDASSSNLRYATIESHNENNIPVVSMYFRMFANPSFNGGADVEFWTTPAPVGGASRTTDRRQASGVINTLGYNNPSDYRIKTNVQNLNSTLNDVCKLRPISYNRLFSDGVVDSAINHGFIAHEVQELEPFSFAVTGIKDGVREDGQMQLQALNYSLLVPALVKSIQELKQQLDSALERITELESK